MYRLFDRLAFTWERLWQHRVLTVWALIGLTAATTLALSLVLYVDAVNTSLLSARLGDPPYAFRLRYLGSWEGAIDREQVETTSAAVTTQFAERIGLPVARRVEYVRAGIAGLRTESGVLLGNFGLAALSGAEDQMEIVAGEWPPAATSETDANIIPVLLPERMLYSMGIQLGDTLTLQRIGGAPITARVAALWRPVNENATDWIFIPSFFNEVILMQMDNLWAMQTDQTNPVEESDWYMVFDGTDVKTSDISGLLTTITDAMRVMNTTLPGIRLDLSPVDAMAAFSIEVNLLTQQLALMLLPVTGLVLYFVSLVASLLVSRQQSEDVTLRSRGMSRGAIVGLHALIWLTLALSALGLGLVLSPLVVDLVSRTRSFLRFDGIPTDAALVITPAALAAGAATSLLAASSGLFMAWRSSAVTITGLRRANARSSSTWWQRAYLDVLLFIPGCYALISLWGRGGLSTEAENPFGDPLTFMGPTLFSLGLTLLFLRIWPVILRIWSRIVSLTTNVSMLMALRELTRALGRYRGTLLMMCFTLSLSGYTASMASTIDRSLADSIDYRIGADTALIVASEAVTEQSGSGASATTTVTGYNTLPAENLLSIEGVDAVSRVGRFNGQLMLGSQRLTGTILGIDRDALASIAYFRDDYANEPLADLMNKLAGDRSAVLISAETAETYHLVVGQEIQLQVSALNTWYDLKVPIAGIVDYFPTLDPRGGFFVIGNLDPIMELVGTELPHDVWLGLDTDADLDTIKTEVRALGYPILEWQDPAAALQTALSSPSRRGVLGFLSVGFVASICLTLVSAIIQNAASFRAQAAQLGSLRAMGLGSLSVALYLLLLQGIAALSGIASGTAIGIVTTLLFLPLLDFSGGLPPYRVQVAWNDIVAVYGLFAGVLFGVTLFTTLLMGRERVTALVKLGDV